MKNKIRELRERNNISQTELARIVGVVRSAMCQYESGARQIPDEIKIKLSDYFHVSVDYLLGRTEISNIANGYVPESIIAFPVIGSVRAGYDGMIQEYDTGEFIPVPIEFLHRRPSEDYMVFEIKGDSMYPLYSDGDRVLVLRTDSVDSGTNAVILYNGDEATVKKVRYKQGEDWLELIPFNKSYPTKRIEGADLGQCRVLGRVVTLLRDPNKLPKQPEQIKDEYSTLADQARVLNIPPEYLEQAIKTYGNFFGKKV